MKAITRTTAVVILNVTIVSLISIAIQSTHAQQQPVPQQERLVTATSATTTTASIGTWRVAGPIGGDVRTIEVDPNDAQRLYLGTLDGQIYTSADSGQSWKRLETFDRPGIYIDHIIIDPRDSKTIYVGAHKHKEPGGFFKSTDGGQTWRESEVFKNQAIHSLTQSPTTPDILIVGTNDGIYRSIDAGELWNKFDTSVYPDLINVESVAIDPRSDNQIYAGTWHLPWKTMDGGKTWSSIKNGIIDDSDVFSISIDPRNADHVIASACSGIYETKNAGTNWHKVQGIPSQSRRTRAILQHPSSPGIVFAGTTEGFWRSTNGGSSWMLITTKKLEINSIAVHKNNPNTVYIGTNNYGVMISHDNGKTFSMSNEGYSGRLAFAVQPDREKQGRVYATTINTTTGGGFFFVSDDSGQTWRPAMRNMPSTLFAKAFLQDLKSTDIIYLGTNLGMYVSLDRGESWAPLTATRTSSRSGKSSRARSGRSADASSIASTETNKQVQTALNAAGFEVGTPDGRLGKRSLAALKKFQTSKGLPATGKLDAATLDALGIRELKRTVPT
ncbi:MAG: peptidoglycan-binding protein, partial [Pyrinomonadaceae bacterium]